MVVPPDEVGFSIVLTVQTTDDPTVVTTSLTLLPNMSDVSVVGVRNVEVLLGLDDDGVEIEITEKNRRSEI